MWWKIYVSTTYFTVGSGYSVFPTPSKQVCVCLLRWVQCLCGRIDVHPSHPPPPDTHTPPCTETPALHWDAGRLNLIPGELIRISGEERRGPQTGSGQTALLSCIVMPSAPSLCLFGLAACQLIWTDGRWEIGPLKLLTTMLNTHALTHAQINTRVDTYGATADTHTHTHIHRRHMSEYSKCVRLILYSQFPQDRDVWSGTRTNRVVTYPSCYSQQRLVWCMTIREGCEQGQTRCHPRDTH